MRWIKRGEVFRPSAESGWLSHHAQGPTVLSRGAFLRIYFAGRPEHSITLPTFIDVSSDDPRNILRVNRDPLLPLGGRGDFDEFGIIPTEVIEVGDEVWMYYTGWQRGVSVSYTLAIGLAISRDGGQTFKKAYVGPIIDRTRDEPYMTMSPFIVREGASWHCWYASGVGFLPCEGKYEPQYVIKYAVSSDGLEWKRSGAECLPRGFPEESTTRPTVVKIGEVYHMWFCYRGADDYRGGRNSYRVGYASSTDLHRWERDDARAGITVSQEGWDSLIITYPYVVRVGDQYMMFYNGNGFGATGFGYAVAAWD